MQKIKLKMSLCLALLFATLTVWSQTGSYPGFESLGNLQGYEEYKLSKNDLKVILKQDNSVPVSMFMVTYLVGSRNETIGNTGATHLLEHLMFKGTPNFNKEKGNSYDKLIEGVGGLVNATTWFDRTNYYALVPAEYLERLIEVEADRMRNLTIKKEDKESEMTVVRNEYEIGENDSQSALDKAIWSTAYFAHPYHHSTIGWRSDIENVTVEKLKDFYDTYYYPNNATVVVAGNFDKAKTLALINKFYGSIEKSKHTIPQVYTTEPTQEGARRVIVKRSGTQGVVGVAHKTPKGLDKESYVMILIERALTGGKTSRLYKALIEKSLASSVNTWYSTFRDEGLFPVYARLTPNTEHEKVEKVILEEYEKIKKEGFNAEELKKVKAQVRAEFLFGMDGPFSIAATLNEGIAIGDWKSVPNFTDNIQKVSLEEMNQTFKKYFVVDLSTVGWFIPLEDKEETSGSILEKPRPAYYKNPDKENEKARLLIKKLQTPTEIQQLGIADKITDKKIENIRLLTLKTDAKEIVNIQGSIIAGDVFNTKENSMVANMTASMIDQGTLLQDKFAIAEQLANMGASIYFSAGANTMNFSARFLKGDEAKIFKLLAEQLRKPAFKESDLEILKKRTLAQLKQDMDETDVMASEQVMAEIFPIGHPNYPTSIAQKIKDLEKITVQDLKNFHNKYYGNKSMTIAIVGDLEYQKIEKALKDNFAGWNGGVALPKSQKTTPKVAKNKTIVKTMKDKTNVSVVMATPIAMQMDEKDYLALEVATSILGGKFTARLMSTVRDQEGLTYGIYSYLGNSVFTDGAWILGANFSPSLLEKGLNSTNRELNKWINEGITQQELDAEKIYAAGDTKVGLSNTNQIAYQILNLAQRNASLKLMDEKPEKIKALTLAEVNQAIKKYIQPQNIQVSLAGSIDNNFKEIKKSDK